MLFTICVTNIAGAFGAYPSRGLPAALGLHPVRSFLLYALGTRVLNVSEKLQHDITQP